MRLQRSTVTAAVATIALAGGGGVAWACTGPGMGGAPATGATGATTTTTTGTTGSAGDVSNARRHSATHHKTRHSSRHSKRSHKR